MPPKDTAHLNKPAKSPLVGAQISTAGGFAPVPERALALGAEAAQVFSSNPRMWKQRTPGSEELQVLLAGLRQHRLPLFLHTIYLINLATPDEQLRRRSIDALSSALVLGARVGAAGVVTHVGSHRGAGMDAGCSLAADAVDQARQAAGASIARQGGALDLPPLLLETGAGGGNSVGGRLDDLATLLAGMPGGNPGHEMGICVDTAHLHAAGYPVHEEEGLETVIRHLAELGLLARVGLVHLNDSATPFGSARDVHQNPGDGCIGYEGLARVVRHTALAHIPFVLETPGHQDRGPDAADVAMVKAMRSGKPEPAARRAARTALKRAAPA